MDFSKKCLMKKISHHSLKADHFLESKLGKSCIEIGPAVNFIKKDDFYFFYFFHDEMNIFFLEYVFKAMYDLSDPYLINTFLRPSHLYIN